MSDDGREKLLSLFGKLEVRYTRWHAYITFEGTTRKERYRVVARDADSVVLVSPPTDGFGGGISHIHFESGCYWIILGKSNMREFFTRVL